MTHWEVKFNVAGIVFFSLAIYIGSSVSSVSWFTVATGLIPTLLLVIFSFLALHIASLKPAPTQRLKPLLHAYVVYFLICPILAKLAHRKTRCFMKHPQEHQDKVLMNILDENGQTALSRDYGLGDIKSRGEFRKKVSLNKFNMYEKYIERIVNGEQKVMTEAEIIQIISSSGTTGKSKLYPLTNVDLKLHHTFALTYFHTIRQAYRQNLDRVFDFFLYHPTTKTKAGLTVGGYGLTRDLNKPNKTNPAALSKITKEGPNYFVQALFSLRDSYVGYIMGFSSDLMFAFFKSVYFNKEAICNAIATGFIQSFPGLDDDVRQELNKDLIPDPERAKKVKQEIEAGENGFATRIWPRLKGVMVARTGSFEHSATLLQNTYLRGLNIFFGLHGATEGLMGVAMTAEDLRHEVCTFVTNYVFLEFIKIGEIDQDQPKTYLLSELEIGQLYEVVITNWYGLYRNRFGDVIKVVGFTENTPKYIFQYRTGQILNCGTERTDEMVFYDALIRTEAALGISVVNYTSTESMYLEEITGDKSRRNHYIAFFEINDDTLTEALQSVLEQNLCELQQTYAAYRDQERIGPIRTLQVIPGTFDSLRSILWGDRPNVAYKTPRVLRNREALLYLWNNRL